LLEKQIKITSYDVQPNSIVKPSSLQKYMQQIAREDLLQYDITYYNMRDDGIVFVLVKLALEFYKPIYTEETISLKTWEKEIKGATFIREFEIYRDNERVAACSTHWVLLDFIKRSIARPSRLMYTSNSFPQLSCGVEIEKSIFDRNPTLYLVGNHTVMYSDLDENNHLNNSIYPDLIMNYAEITSDTNYLHKEIRRMQINFVTEAVLNDKLNVFTQKFSKGYKTRILYDKDDKVCVDSVVEYK